MFLKIFAMYCDTDRECFATINIYSSVIEMHGGKFLFSTYQPSSMKMEMVGMSFSVMNPKELAYRDRIFFRPSNSACSMGLGFIIVVIVGFGDIFCFVFVCVCSQYHLIS